MASPPHIPQLNVPRKRSSISGPVAGGAKRRKPSQLRNQFSPTSDSVGSPLRFSRSPSVDSVATTSVVNGAGGRKRKRKNDGDNLSVTGSSVRGGRRGDARSAIGAEGQGDQDGGEDEEDDDLEEEMDAVLEGGKVTEATKKQEKEHERYVVPIFLVQQDSLLFGRRRMSTNGYL
jgi:transcription initiation factor TFIID subunit 11